ncbi:MAG: HAD-IIB family hydrolase [Coriobacteriales bacterium]|nr:HAD-IIB family hydrolase [Coriobacteriales bacterium]
MTNLLFVDVDGTLLTLKEGQQYIPPSAIRAMAQARELGAQVYLCTGRSLADARFIANLTSEGQNLAIDGIIGASGGVVSVGDKIIFHRTLGARAVLELEAYLQAHDAHYYLESNEGIFFDPVFMEHARRTWGIAHRTDWDTIARPLEEANRASVNKLCFRAWEGGLTFEDVSAMFGDRFYLVPATHGDQAVVGGEISCRGVNKATAIRLLLDHLALPQVRTFGFGDSSNDIEMLDACDEAIVMGDARESAVREHATYVTSAVLDDGLARAMAHFGLCPAIGLTNGQMVVW